MTCCHQSTAFSEFVDGSNGIDCLVQGPASVKILLDGGQEILAVAIGLFGRGRVHGLDPRMLKGVMGSHAVAGVNSQTASDEVARMFGHVTPVLNGREGVVGSKDGLHFLKV